LIDLIFFLYIKIVLSLRFDSKSGVRQAWEENKSLFVARRFLTSQGQKQ